MSREHEHAPVVGNDFVPMRRRLQMVLSAPLAANTSAIVLPVHHVASSPQTVPVYGVPHYDPVPSYQLREFIRRYGFIILALLFLTVAGLGLKVGSRYWSAHMAAKAVVAAPAAKPPTIAGLNTRVTSAEMQAKVDSIIHQPVTLAVGDDTKAVSQDVIKSWLQITDDNNKSEHYIHVKSDLIAKSLNDLAAKYNTETRNQVVVNHGSVEEVIIAGRNGTRLSDPGGLASQASAAAKTVLDAKGLQFSTPLETAPFQSVTPIAFGKLIEVDVVSKQMWLYENGQLWHSYPISAGAPATPTPIGQFKIYSKFALQDMRGFNVNGTRYFQPNVRWISYFLPGGYAVHGNYWRPSSWFGAVNSSHGCVSLPEYQAKEVYDWSPIGTTVITHY